MKAKPRNQELPSHFAALRFVCDCFEAKMPEMETTLKRLRRMGKKQGSHFPKRLNRRMLGLAEKERGRWCEVLGVIGYETLYDCLRRSGGTPQFGFAGEMAYQLACSLLNLYQRIRPKLRVDGIPSEQVLWILVEEVFVPTAFLELALNGRQGLGTEFGADTCWYLPMAEKHQRLGPVARVLHCWFRAAGFRYAHDLNKAAGTDSPRRNADRWLSGHGRLLAGFIHRQQQALGDGLVLGLEAREGFGGVVKGVVNAFATEEQAVTVFHGSYLSSLP